MRTHQKNSDQKHFRHKDDFFTKKVIQYYFSSAQAREKCRSGVPSVFRREGNLTPLASKCWDHPWASLNHSFKSPINDDNFFCI